MATVAIPCKVGRNPQHWAWPKRGDRISKKKGTSYSSVLIAKIDIHDIEMSASGDTVGTDTGIPQNEPQNLHDSHLTTDPATGRIVYNIELKEQTSRSRLNQSWTREDAHKTWEEVETIGSSSAKPAG